MIKSEDVQATIEELKLDADEQAYFKRLRCHDWYYSFSDDGSVYRAGDIERTSLMAEASEKRGNYLTLWNRCCDLCNKSIKG